MCKNSKLILPIILIGILLFSNTLLAQEQPNIVFMLADDMGWNEPAFNGGNENLTPNMKRLSENGVRLNKFYVHAVCAPTRAAFLTGRYAFRTWSDWRSEDYGKPTYLKKLGLTLAKNDEGEETRRLQGLDTNERTIAEALREAGYFTSLIGKWHLGEWLPEHLPMGQGFDHQYGHYGWGIDYNNYTIPHNAPARFAVYDWHRNQRPLFEQGYSTDLIANEAVRVISQFRPEEGKSKKPFFIYVPFNAIHGPLEEIPRYRDKYEKRQAALKCLDDAVGRIVGAVHQNGLLDNTLIVFANDNGGLKDEQNAPYRGTKNTNYEGGVRVPCVFSWPRKLKPGSTVDELMHITDLFPTFLNLGRGSAVQQRELDGIDMTGVIFDGQKSARRQIVFEVSGSVRPACVLRDNYKLIGKELFDLERDPYEKTDVAAANPEIVKQLFGVLEKYASERPPLGNVDRLMSPALPWVYGQSENATAPDWVKEIVQSVRDKQPKEWAPGKTPWPQAPKDGKIIYTGDGR
jgi:arylsulfatase A-like enzyme